MYSLPTYVKVARGVSTSKSPYFKAAVVKFDSHVWRKGQISVSTKLGMAKELVKSQKFVGLDESELIEQLGEPSNVVEFFFLDEGAIHCHAFKYAVTPGFLYFRFDESGKVTHVDFSCSTGNYL